MINHILPAKLETGQVLKSISHREPSSLLLARLNAAAYRAQRAGTELVMLRKKAPAAAISLGARCASLRLAADVQEEIGETLPASARSVTHPHTWKSWRGDKNTSLK